MTTPNTEPADHRLYALRWRLVYAGGLVVTEPPEHASIRDRPPGVPLALRLVSVDDREVAELPLAWQGRVYRPIFYRRRSAGLGPPGVGHLDMVVWGRGGTADITALAVGAAPGTVQVQLHNDGIVYACYGGRLFREVPPQHLDGTMIQLQLEG